MSRQTPKPRHGTGNHSLWHSHLNFTIALSRQKVTNATYITILLNVFHL
jgi:hypothetical protein